MDRALVLHGRVGLAPDDACARWLEALPYHRRTAAGRLDDATRRASLAGIALALEGLSRLLGRTVRAAEIAFPEGGRPVLAGGPSFSISHSGDVVAVALSGTARVGFDVELVSPGRDVARLEHWTAVEAVLKADGQGLRAAASVVIEPDRRRGTLGDASWRIVPVDLGAGIVASLASDRVLDLVEVETVDLSASPIERGARAGP